MTTENTQVEILVQHIGKPGIKYSAYMLARRLGAQAWIKAVPPLRKWKDLILSSNGRPEIVGDEVEFEGRRFYFAAPHHVFAKARNHGIEAKICRLILDSCRPGDVCVDIGANYGFLSCIMALAVGPSGCVHAFEPAAPVAAVVSETMRKNRFDGFCNVVTAAVGSEETDAASIDSYAGRVEVPVVTIDAFLKKTGQRLAFLKIDVDGGDLAVLQGARATLERDRPIVVTETSRDQRDILGLLNAIGYSHILDLRGTPVTGDPWPPNVIAAMRDIAVPPRGTLTV